MSLVPSDPSANRNKAAGSFVITGRLLSPRINSQSLVLENVFIASAREQKVQIPAGAAQERQG